MTHFGLDVVRAHPDKLRVVGLAAGANADLLLQQALEFQPAVVAMASEDALGTVTPAVDIVRKGQTTQNKHYTGPRYGTVGPLHTEASDHCPVIVTLEL